MVRRLDILQRLSGYAAGLRHVRNCESQCFANMFYDLRNSPLGMRFNGRSKLLPELELLVRS